MPAVRQDGTETQPLFGNIFLFDPKTAAQLRMDNKKVPRSDMDQVHLPDPVLTDIRELQEENIKLHKRLESMIKYMRCVEKENKESKNDEDL